MVLKDGGATLVADESVFGRRPECIVLRARQPKGSPYAPEKLTPTPAVKFRVDIVFLAQGLEGTHSLSVGKDVQRPKQFVSHWMRPDLETIAGRKALSIKLEH